MIYRFTINYYRFFIILLLLLKYPFNFKQNKKHFSIQRNVLTLEC